MAGCVGPPPAPISPDLPLAPVAETLAGIAHDLGAVKGQDYSILTYAGGLCTFVALLAGWASFVWPNPLTRRLATGSIMMAVACWALRVLLVKYLWLAILVAVVGGVLVGLLYVYGHRKVFRKRLGV